MLIHINRAGQTLGPYDEATVHRYLQNGSLQPGDMAWHEGAADWVPLGTMPMFAAPAPANAPLPPAPFPPAAYPAAPRAGGGGGKALFWVLGGCGGLLALGFLAFVVLAFIGARQKATTIASTARVRLLPKTYVNTREVLPAKLQKEFIPFRFDYPERWALLPHDETNFVKVERYGAKGAGNTAENFAVGYLTFKPASGMDDKLMPMILDQLRKQFAAGFPKFQELADLGTTVAGVPGRQLVFQAQSEGIRVYGKTILLHRQGQDHGVCIIMLSTPEATDIKTAFDLGLKGDTADILNSFQML